LKPSTSVAAIQASSASQTWAVSRRHGALAADADMLGDRADGPHAIGSWRVTFSMALRPASFSTERISWSWP